MNIIRQSSKKITAAAILAAAVVFSAAGTELISLLPSYAATAAGVNVSALCSHRQGAILFEKYIVPLTSLPVNQIGELFYACDAAGRRRVMLAHFTSPQIVTGLTGKLAEFREDGPEIPLYILRKTPEDRKIYRLYILSPQQIALYWRFPKNRPFQLDQQGLPDGLRRLVPQRSGLMLWVVGFPRSSNQYLRQITVFDLALESDCNDELRLHGKIVCQSASGAAMAMLSLNTVVPGLLANKYNIPPRTTAAAVQALQLRREGKILRFSTGNIEPVMVLLAAVIKDMIPEQAAVSN